MTHSSLELLTPPYLNTRKASPHPAQCWWRERQNRGAYNTSTDERQSNGEGLERERTERAREKEKERLIKNVLLGCAEGLGAEFNYHLPFSQHHCINTSLQKKHPQSFTHSNRTESQALQYSYLFNSRAWMCASDCPIWKNHSQLPFTSECLRTINVDILFKTAS